MRLYAESSAVLAWLLNEPDSDAVRKGFAEAEIVLSSDLTLLECERVLMRAAATGQMPEGEAANRKGVLRQAAAHWAVLHLDDEVLERARQPFPTEPVRTLDAIHLASVLIGRTAVPGLQMASLDTRIRENSRSLGIEVWP